MTKSKKRIVSCGRRARSCAFHLEKRDIDEGRRIHPSTSALTYDEKRLVKKSESIIKLAFYSAEERIERWLPRLATFGWKGGGKGRIGGGERVGKLGEGRGGI